MKGAHFQKSKSTEGLAKVEPIEETKPAQEEIHKNIYGDFEEKAKTIKPRKVSNPTTNIEKFRAMVKKTMDEGLKLYGTQLNHSQVVKIDDKKKTKRTNYLNGLYLVEEVTTATRGKVFELSSPSLYMKGDGENFFYKQVLNDDGDVNEVSIFDDIEETKEDSK